MVAEVVGRYALTPVQTTSKGMEYSVHSKSFLLPLPAAFCHSALGGIVLAIEKVWIPVCSLRNRVGHSA